MHQPLMHSLIYSYVHWRYLEFDARPTCKSICQRNYQTNLHSFVEFCRYNGRVGRMSKVYIMTVTWTSRYSTKKATTFVEWGVQVQIQILSPTVTLAFIRNTMCVFFLAFKNWHLCSLLEAEIDGSNEYNDFERGSITTTYQLVKESKNTDTVMHRDICNANCYLSKWDQFTAQVGPVASTLPYMVASGNHERDWPGSASFYGNIDSGGECSVPTENMFYVPAENREQFWYSTDYRMHCFCVANTELDWRPGTEQYMFIEHCFSSVDMQKQSWLIFLAHRVPGYSSSTFYGEEGMTEEPTDRESLHSLCQKYMVDIAMYGQIHGYERIFPVYEAR